MATTNNINTTDNHSGRQQRCLPDNDRLICRLIRNLPLKQLLTLQSVSKQFGRCVHQVIAERPVLSVGSHPTIGLRFQCKTCRQLVTTTAAAADEDDDDSCPSLANNHLPYNWEHYMDGLAAATDESADRSLDRMMTRQFRHIHSLVFTNHCLSTRDLRLIGRWFPDLKCLTLNTDSVDVWNYGQLVGELGQRLSHLHLTGMTCSGVSGSSGNGSGFGGILSGGYLSCVPLLHLPVLAELSLNVGSELPVRLLASHIPRTVRTLTLVVYEPVAQPWEYWYECHRDLIRFGTDPRLTRVRRLSIQLSWRYPANLDAVRQVIDASLRPLYDRLDLLVDRRPSGPLRDQLMSLWRSQLRRATTRGGLAITVSDDSSSSSSSSRDNSQQQQQRVIQSEVADDNNDVYNDIADSGGAAAAVGNVMVI